MLLTADDSKAWIWSRRISLSSSSSFTLWKGKRTNTLALLPGEEGSLFNGQTLSLVRANAHETSSQCQESASRGSPDVQLPASPLVVLDNHSPFAALQHSDKRQKID